MNLSDTCKYCKGLTKAAVQGSIVIQMSVYLQNKRQVMLCRSVCLWASILGCGHIRPPSVLSIAPGKLVGIYKGTLSPSALLLCMTGVGGAKYRKTISLPPIIPYLPLS
ncbi:hypothetical protein XELAEV_18046589mg [Xenopus laevis]|uniref:Uncharacterized protein n=1 Tax=Xenopus laevis TaxID=8355 RepID=A0A974BTH3_XENLA|nr:hypothetical protein XELAEV_18046589mg [Xenopus laevis]